MAARRKKSSGGPDLFIEQSGQLRMTDTSAEQRALEKRRVECLRMGFESDEARRAYFLEKLREKLKDPEFHKIEGFPIGKDEDILALSDPPYHTAGRRTSSPTSPGCTRRFGFAPAPPLGLASSGAQAPNIIDLSPPF